MSRLEFREGAVGLMSFAAAPTFAIMAVLTVAFDSAPGMICSSASPLNGMAVMYVLMSAFHTAPWLRLISARAASGRLTPSGSGR